MRPKLIEEVDGKPVEVPLSDHWPAIKRIIHLARAISPFAPASKIRAQAALLAERSRDIEDVRIGTANDEEEEDREDDARDCRTWLEILRHAGVAISLVGHYDAHGVMSGVDVFLGDRQAACNLPTARCALVAALIDDVILRHAKEQCQCPEKQPSPRKPLAPADAVKRAIESARDEIARRKWERWCSLSKEEAMALDYEVLSDLAASGSGEPRRRNETAPPTLRELMTLATEAGMSQEEIEHATVPDLLAIAGDCKTLRGG